ncbi:serine-rich adhesin for platelets-like [Clytia hemisphaerica]|uniref:Uncharacterized protein n=1 Tax=Clytia hemisphaerica TaxID=252671 RepID=A0A7M5XBR0_9CNID
MKMRRWFGRQNLFRRKSNYSVMTIVQRVQRFINTILIAVTTCFSSNNRDQTLRKSSSGHRKQVVQRVIRRNQVHYTIEYEEETSHESLFIDRELEREPSQNELEDQDEVVRMTFEEIDPPIKQIFIPEIESPIQDTRGEDANDFFVFFEPKRCLSRIIEEPFVEECVIISDTTDVIVSRQSSFIIRKQDEVIERLAREVAAKLIRICDPSVESVNITVKVNRASKIRTGKPASHITPTLNVSSTLTPDSTPSASKPVTPQATPFLVPSGALVTVTGAVISVTETQPRATEVETEAGILEISVHPTDSTSVSNAGSLSQEKAILKTDQPSDLSSIDICDIENDQITTKPKSARKKAFGDDLETKNPSETVQVENKVHSPSESSSMNDKCFTKPAVSPKPKIVKKGFTVASESNTSNIQDKPAAQLPSQLGNQMDTQSPKNGLTPLAKRNHHQPESLQEVEPAGVKEPRKLIATESTLSDSSIEPHNNFSSTSQTVISSTKTDNMLPAPVENPSSQNENPFKTTSRQNPLLEPTLQTACSFTENSNTQLETAQHNNPSPETGNSPSQNKTKTDNTPNNHSLEPLRLLDELKDKLSPLPSIGEVGETRRRPNSSRTYYELTSSCSTSQNDLPFTASDFKVIPTSNSPDLSDMELAITRSQRSGVRSKSPINLIRPSSQSVPKYIYLNNVPSNNSITVSRQNSFLETIVESEVVTVEKSIITDVVMELEEENEDEQNGATAVAVASCRQQN